MTKHETIMGTNMKRSGSGADPVRRTALVLFVFDKKCIEGVERPQICTTAFFEGVTGLGSQGSSQLTLGFCDSQPFGEPENTRILMASRMLGRNVFGS